MPAPATSRSRRARTRSLRKWAAIACALVLLPQLAGSTVAALNQRSAARESLQEEQQVSAALHALSVGQNAILEVRSAAHAVRLEPESRPARADLQAAVTRADDALRRRALRGNRRIAAAWSRARVTLFAWAVGGAAGDDTTTNVLRGVDEALSAHTEALARTDVATAQEGGDAAAGVWTLSIVTALTTLLVAASIAILQVRSLRGGLGGLQAAARRFAAGDLAAPVRRSDLTELAEVGEALEVMAGNLRRSEERLQHQAFHDELTGLANRSLLLARVRRCLAERAGDPAGPEAGLVFIDLDGFKDVNDSFGHAAGDELLREAARRFSDCVRDGDLVARLGGDEFAVFLDDCPALLTVDEVAGRLAGAFERPFTLEGRPIKTSATIGTALAAEGMEAEELLRAADIAMYAGKREGPGELRHFQVSMLDETVTRLRLEADLEAAVEAGDIDVHYQPIVALGRDAEVDRVEALARWRHPERGAVPPDVFIDIAERSGTIVALGRHVLRRVCADLPALRERYGSGIAVAVNLSARELLAPDLVASVHHAVASAGVEAASISFELTETALVGNTDLALERLQALRELGFRLALDDFGTGYSSLSYVRDLPFDCLKIDRSFTDCDGPSAAANRALIGTIVSMCRSFGLAVVAEGIETEAQRAWLVDLGCDLGQGFLFASPAPLAGPEAGAARVARRLPIG